MATKKAPAKKAPVKKAKPATKKPVHPLMLDGKDWDREKVMAHVCDCLATSTCSIGKILLAGYNGYNLPSYSAIMNWIGENEGLMEKYAHAREAQADFMAEEILEIADNASNDWMEREDPENPGFTLNGENIQRSRLRVDSRKWLASKLKPKKYGEKMQHSGTIGLRHEDALAALDDDGAE